MSILLVDIGNSRTKCAVLRGQKLGAARAFPHAPNGASLAALVRSAPRDVARVIAVSVAGARSERALARAVLARFGLRTEFIRSARSAAGVRNGYRDVWRLGADRWVAVVGAHALAGARAALVVNVGTAMTIDAVTARGRHLGGAIAPGPALMYESLLSGTQGIRRRARGTRPKKTQRMFAADTASALSAGAAFACAALVDRAVAEAARTPAARPLLLLTGGAAASLQPYIKSAFRRVPDLVLRGLAVFARSAMDS